MCTQVCGTRVDECGGVSKAAEWRARNSCGGRAGAHVSAFLALGSLALTLIVVVGRVLLLLCCNVNRTNSVELLTLHCSSRRCNDVLIIRRCVAGGARVTMPREEYVNAGDARGVGAPLNTSKTLTRGAAPYALSCRGLT